MQKAEEDVFSRRNKAIRAELAGFCTLENFDVLKCMNTLTILPLLLTVLPLEFANAHSPPLSLSAKSMHIVEFGAATGQQNFNDDLAVTAAEDGARLRCMDQRIEGMATTEGLWLTSTAPECPGDKLRILTAEISRAGQEGWGDGVLVAVGAIEVTDHVARFIRPGVIEEYSVSDNGVRQDIILERRPPGQGQLRVALELIGANAEPSGEGIRLVPDRSGRNLRYDHLRVVDANGSEIAARMDVIQAKEQDVPQRPAGRMAHLVILMDDSNATYPVRIDPTFSDEDWFSLGSGLNGIVRAMAVSGSNIFVGGDFSIAGGSNVNFVAKWDGSAWSSLGSGMNSNIFALAMSGSDLYAGGNFTVAGGVNANYIAKWNGNSWSALGSGTFPRGVLSLAVMGDDLYVGGQFNSAGGVNVNYIAKWNGSTWSPLGSGIGNYVFALAVSGSNVYAGGPFSTAGGVSANYIAKWDGSTWTAMGTGMNNWVFALALSGSDLYAGGWFSTAGDVGANHIAKWDGNAWSALGLGLDDRAQALAFFGNDLYAGGAFNSAGGTSARRIARWNGNTWSALGSGMGESPYSTVNALGVSGRELYAGGSFTTAGGKPSPYAARAQIRPVLSINRSGTIIKLEWPSAGSIGFALEQTFTPANPASWIANVASVSDDGITKSVTLPATNSEQFFRLRMP
jgi:hypothetical protein